MTVTSNVRGEVQLPVGKQGQVVAGIASAAWIVGWIFFVGFQIYEFGNEPLVIPSY